MRNNQPVSQQEYDFPASDMLVSATDLSGNIKYCNPAFIEVSGYSREELIGQPHNLIRHPDMPGEAFGDMWATIQEGRPWTALVKNRRKNGDYPPQEWRLLLGSRERDTRYRAWQGSRFS
jgi:aerotaxis receptor